MDNSEDLPTKAVALVERNIEPQGIPLNDPEAVAKTSQKDLIALATEIQKADSFIKVKTCSKLQVIAEQIQFLKKQAEDILIDANMSMKLNHIPCNFVKHPEQVYHLYQRETGQLYFSMLSPEEWGTCAPTQIYRGSYRLEQDHSWTPLRDSAKRSEETTIAEIDSAKFLSNLPTFLRAVFEK
ncbi:PREDICTED: uncharacterized protein C1orf50 homolog [Habropoda laboriosa]|nr:PREDICTED: uncharacterized protein C1orf50 homolog [Habropoda laboriosa]XP_017794018.1 PREDICTED: uncharacterized protein C1orf50 homolog [Habropoda laboriosa]